MTPQTVMGVFERNRLRLGPLRQLKHLYPKLLKHHALIQNDLALSLGVHALSPPRAKRGPITCRAIPGGLLLVDRSKRYFLENLGAITRAVRSLSPKGRGSLGLEVAKIPRAMESGRRGPMPLSGGVRAFLSPHRLVLKKN